MNTVKKKLFFLSGKGGSPAPVGLLNTATGAGAAFAISLRMLNADLIGQDAIEVHRTANDDFDRFPLLSTGVDTAAIASFCGASDGIVGWMIDQSGNGHNAVQTALNSAPKIYDSATGIVMENGKPALNFDGNDYLVAPRVIDTDTFLTSVVYTPKSPSGYNFIIAQHPGGGFTNRTVFAQITNAPKYSCFFSNGSSFEQYSSVPYQQGVMVVQGMSHGGGDTHINVNDTEGLTLTGESVVPRDTAFSIGAIGSGSGAINGTISEVLAYKDFRTQRRAIYDNQIAHYGIS